MNREELSARLLATFLLELQEQAASMSADLLALEAEPGDPDRLRSLFRGAHTLKGAARAAGVPLVEESCHALETLLAQARDGKLMLGPEHFALLFEAVDGLADAGRRIQAGTSLTESPLARVARQLAAGESSLPLAAPANVSALAPSPAVEEPSAAAASIASAGTRAERMRVDVAKMDNLLASSEALLAAAARSDSRADQMRELRDLAARCAHTWRKASGKGTRTRSVTVSMAGDLEQELDALARQADRLSTAVADDARGLSQVTEELGQRLRHLRMGRFSDTVALLPRVVRDLAQAAGKDVRLEIVGADVEADRGVLDTIREALLHLVRNAVDHGIELPEARVARGKAPGGTVTVAAHLRGERLTITVADDGAGIDVDAVRRQLERRGRPVPADEQQLVRTLFQGGISTRREANEISGRGVGLDAAREAIETIRGRMDVTWAEGEGTTFTLECPPTLAMLRVILVSVNGHPIAIPMESVERLDRIGRDDIRRADGRDLLPTESGPMPIAALGRLLGWPSREQPGTLLPVVRLSIGLDRRIALLVDALLGEQEVMVRPLQHVRADMQLASGTALLGSGDVALVLRPDVALAAGLDAPPESASLVATAAPTRARRRILVVDDSITTRSLERSVLEAAGYDVATAADGADAWRRLEHEGFDLVVSDVEMPRMDGVALCETIRGSRRLATLPVILVSALESAEHQRRGLDAGADAYVAKSSFDQQALLDTIRQLLG
ncbi:MAG TPA: response regulator [Gemmatimonadales bacterium]|nr:response regulator [Gemmatimonadales bacterium]